MNNMDHGMTDQEAGQNQVLQLLFKRMNNLSTQITAQENHTITVINNQQQEIGNLCTNLTQHQNSSISISNIEDIMTTQSIVQMNLSISNLKQ